MNNSLKSLKDIIENIASDEAIECIVSEMGTHLTKLQTALKLLHDAHTELNDEGKYILEVAQDEVLQMILLMNDIIRDTLIPKLRSP